MDNPKSEAFTAPLLSPFQQRIFANLVLVCDTAAIEGGSLADIAAAVDHLQDHAITARDAASADAVTETLGLRYADDDNDGDGPDFPISRP